MVVPARVCAVFATALAVTCPLACGGGGGGGNTAAPTPTQPSAPPTFSVTAQIRSITFTPSSTPGLEGVAVSDVDSSVTLAELGKATGGRADQIELVLQNAPGRAVVTKTFSRADIIAATGTDRIPAGGQLSMNTRLVYTETSSDIVTLLRATARIIGDNNQTFTGTGTVSVPAPPPCQPSASTLCLHNGRFKVEVAWFDGSTHGKGTVSPVAVSDGGLFWFYDNAKTELTVKVTNGCATNNFWWVYYSSSTNVEFSLSLVDTITLNGKTYTLPPNSPRPTVTDMGAFATCPDAKFE